MASRADRSAAVVVVADPDTCRPALDRLRERSDVALLVGDPADPVALAAAREMGAELFRDRPFDLLTPDPTGGFGPLD